MSDRNSTLENVAHQQLVELFDTLALLRVAGGHVTEADRAAFVAMAMGKVQGVIDALTPHV